VKKILLSVLLVALLLGRAPLASGIDTPAAGAADTGPKPVAIVSIAGYDRIISDIAFIGVIAQKPGLEKMAEGVVALYAQGLNGLDKTRPWGVVVNTDGSSFSSLAFLPVTDVKKLLASAQALGGPAEDEGDGVYSLESNNQKIYVKEQGGWAFLAQTTDALGELPADPSKWLHGLDKKYEIGLQFNIANVPEMYRSMAIDQLKAGVQFGLQQQPDEDEATFELRQKMIQNQMKSFEDLINEADQITIGWSLDQKAKLTALDVNVTALTDSDLAKKFAMVKQAPSNYSGFAIPNAAMSVGFTRAIAKDDIEQANSGLDALKATAEQEIDKSDDLPDDNAKSAAKEIVGALLEALKSTIASGKTDGEASLLLGSKKLTVIAGVYIAQPADVEKALKKLAEVSAKDPSAPKFKFNADKHGDVRFHTAKFPVPPGDLAKVIGSSLDVAVGIGPKSVYLGLGTDMLGALKSAIDKSKVDASKLVAPSFVDISVRSILEFANAVEPNPLNQALSDELAKAPEKDHLQAVLKPISNGAAFHLEIQEGVLNLIGVAANMQNGGPPPRKAGPGGAGRAPLPEKTPQKVK
jgi:hypothetical protein